MRGAELGIALVVTALGVRSAVHWARLPFASTAVADQALYALYRTGRVGLWFAFAGLFWLFAFARGTTSTGQPITRDVSQYSWFVLLFAALAVMQLLGGWFLGHRGSANDPGELRGETGPPEH